MGQMKKTSKKGFTVAELLIVVGIIAVLVAIAIPVFTAQLDRAKDAADQANGRALYAIAMKPDEGGDYCVKALVEAPAEVARRFHGVVRGVGVLGGPDEVPWRRDGQGLHIHTDYRMGDMPVTFRIALD